MVCDASFTAAIQTHSVCPDLDTKFPFVQGARFNPEKGCTPGTRIKFLDAITNWANNVHLLKPWYFSDWLEQENPRLPMKSQKTFHSAKRLTTSYCFMRGQPSSREYRRFFTTLARDIQHSKALWNP